MTMQAHEILRCDQLIAILEKTELQFSRSTINSIETPFGEVKFSFDFDVLEFQCVGRFESANHVRRFANYIESALSAWNNRYFWEKDKYNPFPQDGVNSNNYNHTLWNKLENYSFPEDIVIEFSDSSSTLSIYYVANERKMFCGFIPAQKLTLEHLYFVILGMVNFYKEFDDSIPAELKAITQ